MSYNNNGLTGRASTGSMSSGCPFVIGGRTYGGSNGSASATSFGSSRSVRDCMYWPASLPTGGGSSGRSAGGAANQGFSFSTGGYQNGGGSYANTVRAQPAAPAQVSYPQPKAYLQYPGMGAGGESKYQPVQIPCHLGPSGTQMAPMSTPEPMTIKVTAPPGAGYDGQPIAFKIDPSQYLASMSSYTTPKRR